MPHPLYNLTDLKLAVKPISLYKNITLIFTGLILEHAQNHYSPEKG
jgi:hypothetical protein